MKQELFVYRGKVKNLRQAILREIKDKHGEKVVPFPLHKARRPQPTGPDAA